LKAKYFVLGLLIFSSIAFSSSVQAAGYELAIKEDDEFIWTLNTLDENGMQDIWGDNWDDDDMWRHAEQGARMKAEIDKVDDKDSDTYSDITYLTYEYDVWYFDDYEGDKFGTKDDDGTVYLYSNPKDDYDTVKVQKESLYPSQYAWIWPVDTEDYWSDIGDYWADFVKIKGLTIEMEFEEDDIRWNAVIQEDCKIILTYNNDGVLQNAKILDNDDDVVAEWSLGFIPGYELPILLGITAIFSLGIIYVVLKKKK